MGFMTPNSYGILIASVSMPHLITKRDGSFDRDAAESNFSFLDWTPMDGLSVAEQKVYLAACAKVKLTAAETLGECNTPPCLAPGVAQIAAAVGSKMLEVAQEGALDVNVSAKKSRKQEGAAKKRKPKP
jgi:hypothetical protein